MPISSSTAPTMPQDPILRKITLIIVDDHPIWREGLRHILGDITHIEILDDFGGGEAALAAARELHPDVILLDVNLPDINGIQVATRLKDANHTASIIILTAYDDESQAFHAMQAGCAAYCPKGVPSDELIETIHRVMAGQYLIRGEVFNAQELDTWLKSRIEVVSGAYVVKDHEQLDLLSPREMEILEHVTAGLSNRQIAQELQISYQTVKNHVSSVLVKLGVHDRMQAALYAIRRGWVRLNEESDS